MYQKFLLLAGLVLASTAQAQTPDRTIMRHIAASYVIAGTPSTTNQRADPTPLLHIRGERALLGRVEDPTLPAEAAGSTDAPSQSSFRAEIRGNVTGNAWGEAVFGTVHAVDESSVAFVVSLGVCGEQSAILFTRRTGEPLAVGRYRISEGADGENEIMALVLTGSPTRPTGVFRGESGWLVVTAASDEFTAGQFEIAAIGFTAAEPGQEDRRVNVIGSFSATTAGSSFRVCENAE